MIYNFVSTVEQLIQLIYNYSRPLPQYGIHLILEQGFIGEKSQIQLFLYAECLARKHMEHFYNIFGMTFSKIELKISRSQGKLATPEPRYSSFV